MCIYTTSGGRKGPAIWTPLLLTIVVSIFLQYPANTQNLEFRMGKRVYKEEEENRSKSYQYGSIGKILVNGGSILASLDIQLII